MLTDDWITPGRAASTKQLPLQCTYARRERSAVKVPRSVDFDAELPRHATGKLYKRLLLDRYWGKRDGRIV